MECPAGRKAAAFRFIALERCCRQQPTIEATGRPPVLVPPQHARCSRGHVGGDDIGGLRFQPVYDRLVQTDPDMFDWRNSARPGAGARSST